MPDQSPVPSLFVFNVSKAGSRHTCEVPNDAHLLLPTFSSALNSARKNNYIVQGAIYGPTGATIFIDTEDEHWDQRVDSDIPANVKNILTVSTKKTNHADTASESSVQIFKVGIAPSQDIIAEENDNEPQSLLKEFIEAIHSVLGKGNLVQSAMYGAQEGAKIFISDD